MSFIMQQNVASFSCKVRDILSVKFKRGKHMKSLIAFAIILTTISTTNLFANDRCDLKFSKVNTCVNFDWVYGPFFDQYNSVKVSYNENPEITNIKVIPWMVMQHGHEHGSRPVVMTKTGDREFLIDKIFFMGGMMGEWFLRIQLLDSNNAVLEEQRQLINL